MASFHKVLAGLIPSKDKLSLNQDCQSTKSQLLSEDKKEIIISKISNTTNELEPGTDSETSSINCQMCDYKNNSPSNMKTHMGFKHFRKQVLDINGPNLKECVFCNKATPREYSLIIHLVNKHSALDRIQESNISNEEELKSKINSNALTYKCLSCEVKSENYSDLMIHMAYQHKVDIHKMFGANEWSCSFCANKEMYQVKHLMYHLVSKHTVIAKFPEKLSFMVVSEEEIDQEEDTIICHVCEENFQTNADLLSHVSQHYQDKELPPIGRGKPQADENESIKHFKTKHNPSQNSDKLTKLTRETLEEGDQPKPHKKLDESISEVSAESSKNSDIECKICSEKYPDEQALTDHMKLKHKSQNRSKAFDTAANRQFAMPIAGAWHCRTCNKNHSSATALLEHMKSTHQSFDDRPKPDREPDAEKKPNKNLDTVTKTIKDLDPELEDKKTKKPRRSKTSIYKCPECTEKNSSYAFLLTHIALAHYRDNMLGFMTEKERKCCICSHTYDTKLDLVYHLTNDHNVLDKYLPPKSSMAFLIQTEEPQGQETVDSVTKFRCHVCLCDFLSYETLLNHHATSHFKKKLIENYGNDYNQCFHCSKNYKTQTQLLLHLGKGLLINYVTQFCHFLTVIFGILFALFHIVELVPTIDSFLL